MLKNWYYFLIPFVVFVQTYIFIILLSTDYHYHQNGRTKIFQSYDYDIDYFNTCALPIYDFFDPIMKYYIDLPADFNITHNCPLPLTELKNGIWREIHNRSDIKCRARCHWWYSSYQNTISVWTDKEMYIGCEFVESVCSKNGVDIYGYMHTQVLKRKLSRPIKHDKQHDVIVILLDSLSFGQAKRTLPKTTNYLSKQYEAVEFPFMNKVGVNSMPNGVALWFGKQMSVIDRSMFGGNITQPDWSFREICDRYLDNETSIFKEFSDNGYVTMNGDDWMYTMLHWPSCYGFKYPPYHHNLQPFQIAVESEGENVTLKHLITNTCREWHHPYFEYLEDFMTVYKDHPKFSWLWLSNIGHDDYNGFARIDDYLTDYFQRNKEKFDESFVFVMGDHGSRFISNEIGGMELSNPYLSISIPKKMRKNTEILKVMKENALKLQTHYDTRATMLDILKYQSTDNTVAYRNIGKNEKGSSLLREQPKYPRTCGTLPIPTEYCICRMSRVIISDSMLEEKFGPLVADMVNQKLIDNDLVGKCEELDYLETTQLEIIEDRKNSSRKLYIIQVKMDGPAYSTFEGYLQYDKENDKADIKSVIRIGSYGHTADCITNAPFRPFCYCRIQSTESDYA